MTQYKAVEIFTDGACKGNPGPGGWGVLLRFQGTEKCLLGSEPLTTNNRMELMAVIQGLRVLKYPCHVELYSDSKYVINGATQWLAQWKEKNYKQNTKNPVKNIDLWMQVDTLLQLHQINWHWVRGHSGHPENERVDALANEAILKLQSNNH